MYGLIVRDTRRHSRSSAAGNDTRAIAAAAAAVKGAGGTRIAAAAAAAAAAAVAVAVASAAESDGAAGSPLGTPRAPSAPAGAVTASRLSPASSR